MKAIKEADIKYKTSEKASLEKQISELTSDIEGEQTELDAVLDYYEKLKYSWMQIWLTSKLVAATKGPNLVQRHP